jgi:hypothetical protein
MGRAAAAWPACTLAIEMPKPLMTRWLIGIALAAVAVLGIASVWQARSADDSVPARSAAGEPSDKPRRQQELRFLKAAFDRLEAEAKQNPNSPALRSLRAEQQAVVLQMREVAHPLRADSMPEEVRRLLGIDPASREPTLILPRDPALSGLVLIVRPRPPRPASDAPAEKSAERQPASAEAKPAAKPQATVRSPERTLPSGAVGTIERPGSGPVAILGH